MNESDYYEPNWTKSYWGDNYERLLQIKQEYDPENMFQVWNGVGGLRDEADNPMANVTGDDLENCIEAASSLLMSISAFAITLAFLI
jgi:hypothetical protein